MVRKYFDMHYIKCKFHVDYYCFYDQLTFSVTCFRMDVSTEGAALAVRCPDLR